MCGIIGVVAQRNVVPILLNGLEKLEYRGYDSAGIAAIENGALQRIRAMGKLVELRGALEENPCSGLIGIGHTRWATHGVPATHNAHPHHCDDFTLVHNGIMENHDAYRKLQGHHHFESETDSEVIVHLLSDESKNEADFFSLVRKVVGKLEGSYALAVIRASYPHEMIVARHGSPLVIGLGIGENFIASDVLALLSVTSQFIYLEEGDVARITTDKIEIVDRHGEAVNRPVKESGLKESSSSRGEFRHFMLKEIFEQPTVIADALEGRLLDSRVLEAALLGNQAQTMLGAVKRIQIAACGTSYHSGLTAKYWFEKWAGIPCDVDIASELRYRKPVIIENTLLVVISQSGETADTLAVLRAAGDFGYAYTLAICNVPESSMVREADFSLMTHAGPEVGVASTKAFTTQLVVLTLLAVVIGRRFALTEGREHQLVQQLRALPAVVEHVLTLNKEIQDFSEAMVDKHHALFLGRGESYPIAMEGALKLKEISYIHAEAYAAGELKHGPLALVDENMPVIAVMPDDELLSKIESNLSEVRARGGKLYVLTDHDFLAEDEQTKVLNIGATPKLLSPIVFSIVLQLFAYHVAVMRGTDVDQPRNLAKSVTVE